MTTAIRHIDWNAAWQAAKTQSTLTERDADFWTRKAPQFATGKHYKSDYPEQFLKILEPCPDWSVLDVGCGSGTLAIPLADKVVSITALDFSEGMLNMLHQMGIYANLSFTVHPVNRTYADHEDALNSCDWVLDHLTAHEKEKLRVWFKIHLVRQNRGWIIAGSAKIRWAVIWWDSASQDSNPDKGEKP